jgi:large subunit ribosomal protein L18
LAIGNDDMANTDRAVVRLAIHKRIRRKVRGSTDRPRLAIYRSLNHIYAQVIDDLEGRTLVSAATTEKDLRSGTGGNLDAARRVGKAIAERALAKGIEQVVFDRGGYLYHGRIKALTDAAREAGLNKNETAEQTEEKSAENGKKQQ